MNIQAIINNISFPKSIEALDYFVEEIGHFKDDIAFFFHAKTAINSIRRLEIQPQNLEEEIPNTGELLEGLERAKGLYSLYGGKIFALGRVKGASHVDKGEWQNRCHWSGKIYAEIGDICVLKNPIELSEFSDFIMLSRQSAITPLLGESYDRLKKIITEKNKVPTYLKNSTAVPIPLNRIDKENWIALTQEYRNQFFLEIQFRKFYVDYFLKEFADRKVVFSECTCYKKDKLSGYADYGIYFEGKVLFIEVKINFEAEGKIQHQLEKYSQVQRVLLKKKNGNIQRKSFRIMWY